MAENKHGYQAFLVPNEIRDELAMGFPPRFPDFVGHHVTYRFGVSENEALPGTGKIEVVGYALDRNGLEALVVTVNGDEFRPDGLRYHITWSLNRSKGFRPFDSNKVISEKGWTPVRTGITFVTPGVFLRY